MSQTAQTISELAPIKVERVPLDDGRVLVAKKPLVLYPYLSPCEKYFNIDYPPLNIILFAESYEELEQLLYYFLDSDWRTVVEDMRTVIAAGPKNLRENFHEHFAVQK